MYVSGIFPELGPISASGKESQASFLEAETRKKKNEKVTDAT